MRILRRNLIKLLVIMAILGSLMTTAAMPASAASGIVLGPSTGAVGTSVTVIATGYAPSTILLAKFDGAVMTTAPSTVATDTTGAATFAVLIPTATAGAHVISATDAVNTSTAFFTVQPKVVITSPTSKSGPVGSSVTVVGTGFSGAGVTADVRIGGKTLKSGVVVDSTGSFTATGTVPSMGPGAATATAADGAGNAAVVTATFTVTPTMTLTPTSGMPGSTVALTGSGWPASATVTVQFAGSSLTNVIIAADSNGRINAAGTANYVIPAAASSCVKTVTGTSGTVTATTTFTVVPRLLNLSPGRGSRGTRVLVTGSNMTPGGTITIGSLVIGGRPWNTRAIPIDTSGAIAPTVLTVPFETQNGPNNVVAFDSGGLIASQTFVVTVPTLLINPDSGPRGSTVTFTGSGWVPGAAVTISFAGTILLAVPDSNGNITAATNVPSDAVIGINSVTVHDTLGNTAGPVTFTVLEGPTPTPTPTVPLGPAQSTRHLPASLVLPGQTFVVTVTFAAPADRFNSIGLADNAPTGWTVQGNLSACAPDANFANLTGNRMEYLWTGPYSQGTAFIATYSVTVPPGATAGSYPFSGNLAYYIAGVQQPTENIVGDEQVTVQLAPTPTPTPTESTPVTGITREINGDILSGVTITLDGTSTVVSDQSGQYQIPATTTGSHTLVAHKDGFRDRTQIINIAGLGPEFAVTCNFQGTHGLIPNAPDMGYALSCINRWLYPPNPDTGLDIWTALDVINAWLYPVQ